MTLGCDKTSGLWIIQKYNMWGMHWELNYDRLRLLLEVLYWIFHNHVFTKHRRACFIHDVHLMKTVLCDIYIYYILHLNQVNLVRKIGSADITYSRLYIFRCISLWPSDATLRHNCGSTLLRVMVYCLSESPVRFLYHPNKGNGTGNGHEINHYNASPKGKLKFYYQYTKEN